MKTVPLICIFLWTSPLWADPQPKTTLSVMDFSYSSIPATEAGLLGDALLSEIVDTKVFNVVERAKRDEILREQGFAQTGACDETSCLIEAGQMLAVQKMVGGSIGKLGGRWTINIRVVDVLTGRVEKAFTKYYKGEVDQLLLNMRENAWEIALTTGITPEELKAQYRKKPSPILFGRFKGTRLKYPMITYGTAILGAGLAAASYYYSDGASSSYDEYIAATSDSDILRYKSNAKFKNRRAGQLSYASAACFIGAAVSYLLRVKKPAESLLSGASPAINIAWMPSGRHAEKHSISLSWRIAP